MVDKQERRRLQRGRGQKQKRRQKKKSDKIFFLSKIFVRHSASAIKINCVNSDAAVRTMSSSSVTSAKDSADDKVNDSANADAPVAPDAPKADEANASAASVSINGGENPVPASSAKAPEEEPELKDLETSLLALERLDRASPDLWPDHCEYLRTYLTF